MHKIISIVFFCMTILSCRSDLNEIKTLSLLSIFTDNSSKIWVIDKVLGNGVNYSSMVLSKKDVMLFYRNSDVLIQPMSTLGTFPKRIGKITINEGNTRLFIRFKNEVWRFNIENASSETIFLKSDIKSDFKYDLKLISFPSPRVD